MAMILIDEFIIEGTSCVMNCCRESGSKEEKHFV